MNIDAIGSQPLGILQPDAIQAWLKARGWKDDGPEGPSARGFVKIGGAPGDEVLVPTRPTASDFKKFIEKLIDRVSTVEQMTSEAVLNDLTAAGYDVLRVRVLASEDGSLDLDRAVSVVGQSRAALQAAARAAASRVARRSYLGRQAESVTMLLERVKVGQTERGSYIVPLLVPYSFDPSDSPPLMDAFGRRSMRKLATSLIGMDKALGLASGDDVSAPFVSQVTQGVSADLCQSIGRLLAESGDVELSIRWAASQPEDRYEPIRFAASSGATLLRVAQLLREQDPPPPEPVVGYITKLDDDNRRVVINGLVEDRWKKVEFELEDRFRTTAANAWDERKPVIVEGKIKREGKKITVSELANFGVYEVENSDSQ